MNIYGEKINIKKTTEEDLISIQTLWNNYDVMRFIGLPKDLSFHIKKIKFWFEKINENELINHYVITTKDNQFCGDLSYEIDLDENKAEINIKLLPKFQKQGIALEAFKRLIDYIFINEKNIDLIYAEATLTNISAISLYTKIGLIKSESMSQHDENEIVYELSRDNWQ